MTGTLASPIEVMAAMTPALLALNNAHAAELSLLGPERMTELIGRAFLAARIGEDEALLLTFDQTADYDSPNFLWFRARYPAFVYVDRIVVAPRARGSGLARMLYEQLFERARAAGHDKVVCEVNADPPNPASDTFHRTLDFVEVGSALLPNGKTVRYFSRPLT
jgi:hypothetical protein